MAERKRWAIRRRDFRMSQINLKQSALRSLRRSGLLAAAERAYGVLVRNRAAADNRRFLEEMPGVALPPPALMVDPYGNASFRGYWESGKTTAEAIARVAGKEFAAGGTMPALRILDWGCGPARVVRHVGTTLKGSAISACDCNAEAISWANQAIDAVEFPASGFVPPLPYPDSSFELIYGISIFTHLSEELHFRWIRELRRLLSPGGIALLTFQSEAFRPKLLPDEMSRFDRGEIVIRDGVVEGSRMYCAFHPRDFLQRMFEGNFESFEILAPDESIACPQTTVLARRAR
jgi:ubiquinone/menaquinone biosynthesis C-methylase UbiE